MTIIHFPESEHTATIEKQKAKAILKHEPDIILFEYPPGKLKKFNDYEPLKKPTKLIAE